MRATTGTAAGSRHSFALTSLIGLWCALGIATVAAVCVGGVASAAPDDIAGRWLSARKKLTLDISRCEAGWCGVQVEDGRCGRTVLRLGAGEPDGMPPRGTLQLTSDSFRYGVRAFLRQGDGKPVLTIAGHTGDGDPFASMRRTFDFRAEMVRLDAPACTPDNKVS